MTEMSRRFNFDDFDALCAEALDEHYKTDQQMAEEDEAWEQYERWLEHDTDRRPGEIGGVLLRLSFRPDSDPLPDPPEAA